MDLFEQVNESSHVEIVKDGRICMRARFYTPHLMRFLNADPIRLSILCGIPLRIFNYAQSDFFFGGQIEFTARTKTLLWSNFAEF